MRRLVSLLLLVALSVGGVAYGGGGGSIGDMLDNSSTTPNPDELRDGQDDGSIELPPEFAGLVLPEETEPPLPTPTPDTLFKEPAPLRDETTILDLPVAASAEQTITPEAGGSVSLPNGATVAIAPGAVSEPVTVTLQELAVDGPDAFTRSFYRLEPDGLQFAATVTLSFPIDPQRALDESAVSVAVLGQLTGWEYLPAQVDLARGVVTTQTSHFSLYLVKKGNYVQQLDLNRPAVKLVVPYYNQDGAGWCWAVSTQMLLKYYGRDVETWQIAETWGATFDTGLSQGWFLAGFYTPLIAAHGFKVERSYAGWGGDSLGVTAYLIDQLSQGRPVWMAFEGIGHVIVIVGFDRQGLWIQDPSGLAVERAQGKARVQENHLNPVHLTWNEWFGEPRIIDGQPNYNYTTGGIAGSSSGLMHTVVITDAAPSRTAAVTMTILPDDVRFVAPRPTGASNDLNLELKWDGTRRGGYGFEGLPDFLVGMPKGIASNSDTLRKFELTLSNSTDSAVSVEVVMLLDNKPFRTRQMSGSLAPRTSNVAFDLMQNDPYLFPQNLLTPGLHRFALELRANGQPVDTLSLEFQVGPSRPTNLVATPSGGAVALSWDENPEETRGIGNIVYVLWKDRAPHKTVFENAYTDPDGGDGQKHEYRVEALHLPPGGVSPGDSASYLSSLVSEKVEVAG